MFPITLARMALVAALQLDGGVAEESCATGRELSALSVPMAGRIAALSGVDVERIIILVLLIYTVAVVLVTATMACLCASFLRRGEAEVKGRGSRPGPGVEKGCQSQCTYRRDLQTPRFHLLPEWQAAVTEA